MTKLFSIFISFLIPYFLLAFTAPTVSDVRDSHQHLMGDGVYKIHNWFNQIEQDFTTIGTTYLKLDGSNAMTGDLDLDSNSLLNAVLGGTHIDFAGGEKILASKFDASGNIEANTLGGKTLAQVEAEISAEGDYLKNTRVYRIDVNGKLASEGADGEKIAFSNISEAMTAIEADITARISGGETRTDCKYIVKVNPGVYTESFSVPACAFIQFDMAGAELQGDITRIAQQGGFSGDYYTKVVFNGGNASRAEKGHQAVISGDYTTSTNEGTDYLHYTTFSGVQIAGDITASNGTSIIRLDQTSLYDSSKTILGTGTILLEMVNRSRVKAALSGDVSCYDCRDSELNSVNITPSNASTFYNMEFSGSFTFNSTTLNLDANSYKSLMSQSPTLNTVTVNRLEDSTGIANASSTVSGTSVTDALENIDAKIQIGTSKPTCDSSIRGHIYVTESGTGVADVVEICLKESGDTYSWIGFVVVP